MDNITNNAETYIVVAKIIEDMHTESVHTEEFTALCQGKYNILGTFSDSGEAMKFSRIHNNKFCEEHSLKVSKMEGLPIQIPVISLDQYSNNKTAVRMTYSEYERHHQSLRDVDVTYRFALELHLLEPIIETLEEIKFRVSFPVLINALSDPPKNVNVTFHKSDD